MYHSFKLYLEGVDMFSIDKEGVSETWVRCFLTEAVTTKDDKSSETEQPK